MRRITVRDVPDQQFGLIVGGRRVTMRLRHNALLDRWTFDLAIDDAWVLYGRRIVPGVDLLKPFDFGIGRLFAWREDTNVEPNRRNLPAGAVELYHAP